MGGMEEHILVLARGLVKRDVEVAVICSDHDAIEPLRRALGEAGARVHEVPGRSQACFGAARRLLNLTQPIRRYRDCILHLHLTGHEGGDLVVAAGRLAGARAIVRTEHLPPMPPVSVSERRHVQLRDRLMDRIICVSDQTRQDHIALLGREARKLVAIANCVDTHRFAPGLIAKATRTELGLGADAPVIGTVSRLGEHRKGLNYFLDMAADVSAAWPAATFLIVGDGPLRPELEAQAASLGIAERVLFTGTRGDIPELLAAMDIFVMPSLFEGGPITVLEAMAMGKPVVSTPVGMVPDAIEHDTSGLLVTAAQSQPITQAVLRLLENPTLADELGRNARGVVTERFSPAAMVDGVVAVYNDVAASAGAWLPARAA
jgi:glycosyltransferase involved in cell wall biosynthesis